MKKKHYKESSHSLFGEFVREELERQKMMGIINQSTLREECHIRGSYLSDIKRGMVTTTSTSISASSMPLPTTSASTMTVSQSASAESLPLSTSRSQTSRYTKTRLPSTFRTLKDKRCTKKKGTLSYLAYPLFFVFTYFVFFPFIRTFVT